MTMKTGWFGLAAMLVACGAPVEREAPSVKAMTVEECMVEAGIEEPRGSLELQMGRVLLAFVSRGEVVDSDQEYDLGDAVLHKVGVEDGACVHEAVTLNAMTWPQSGAISLELLSIPGVEGEHVWVQFVVDVAWGLTEEVAFVATDRQGKLTVSERLDVRRDSMGPPVFFSERAVEDRDGDGRSEVVLIRDGMGDFEPELVATWSEEQRRFVRSQALSTQKAPRIPNDARDGLTLESAFRVCGVPGEHAHLLAWTCPDGSAPLATAEAAAAARRGSVGGPDGILDLYEVSCPSGVVSLYYDMYACPGTRK